MADIAGILSNSGDPSFSRGRASPFPSASVAVSVFARPTRLYGAHLMAMYVLAVQYFVRPYLWKFQCPGILSFKTSQTFSPAAAALFHHVQTRQIKSHQKCSVSHDMHIIHTPISRNCWKQCTFPIILNSIYTNCCYSSLLNKISINGLPATSTWQWVLGELVGPVALAGNAYMILAKIC